MNDDVNPYDLGSIARHRSRGASRPWRSLVAPTNPERNGRQERAELERRYREAAANQRHPVVLPDAQSEPDTLHASPGIQVLIDATANAAAERACGVLTAHLASLGKDAAWSFIQRAAGDTE